MIMALDTCYGICTFLTFIFFQTGRRTTLMSFFGQEIPFPKDVEQCMPACQTKEESRMPFECRELGPQTSWNLGQFGCPFNVGPLGCTRSWAIHPYMRSGFDSHLNGTASSFPVHHPHSRLGNLSTWRWSKPFATSGELQTWIYWCPDFIVNY